MWVLIGDCFYSLHDNMWDDGNSLGPKEVHNYLTRVMYNRRNKFDPLWNSLILGGVKNGQKYLGSVYLGDHTSIFLWFFHIVICINVHKIKDVILLQMAHDKISLDVLLMCRLAWLVYILRMIMLPLDLVITLPAQFFARNGGRTWLLRRVSSYWRNACVTFYTVTGLLSTSFRWVLWLDNERLSLKFTIL